MSKRSSSNNSKQKSAGKKNHGGGTKIQRKITKRKKAKHTWKSVRDKKKVKSIISDDGNEDKSVQRSESEGASSSQKKKQSLRERMMGRLSVARFRTINETMDSASIKSSTNPKKTASGDPSKNPLSDKSTFKAYHEGLTSTSSSWETHPLDLIIDWIKSKVPAANVIADFGCGTARLADSVPNKTHSFDLHALKEGVTACDMRNVPLEKESVDVVVFCLSLMGLDVTEFLEEGRRVLKTGGTLKIAEVAGRISNTDGDGSFNKFLKAVEGIGFKRAARCVQKVGNGDVFVVMEFRKVNLKQKSGRDVTGRKGKRKVLLGPVTYKKR